MDSEQKAYLVSIKDLPQWDEEEGEWDEEEGDFFSKFYVGLKAADQDLTGEAYVVCICRCSNFPTLPDSTLHFAVPTFVRLDPAGLQQGG